MKKKKRKIAKTRRQKKKKYAWQIGGSSAKSSVCTLTWTSKTLKSFQSRQYTNTCIKQKYFGKRSETLRFISMNDGKGGNTKLLLVLSIKSTMQTTTEKESMIHGSQHGTTSEGELKSNTKTTAVHGSANTTRNRVAVTSASLVLDAAESDAKAMRIFRYPSNNHYEVYNFFYSRSSRPLSQSSLTKPCYCLHSYAVRNHLTTLSVTLGLIPCIVRLSVCVSYRVRLDIVQSRHS